MQYELGNAVKKNDVAYLSSAINNGIDLEEQEGNLGLLHWAVLYRSNDAAQMIVDANLLDANLKDHRGATALHYAARENNLPIAQLLLNAGANAGARDNDGHLPIDYVRESSVSNLLNNLLTITIEP